MANGGRITFAVLAGAVLWACLWVGGTMGAAAVLPDLLPVGEPVTHTGILIGYIIYACLLSVLAGFITARIARTDALRAVTILAVLQLMLGIGFEASAWRMTPVWYHLVFLALIVPTVLYGGKLGRR